MSMLTANAHDTPRRRRYARPGFTLIELLVVIAIIGLLVSILVPSLSAARKQAQSARCLANLHVLGQGATLYLNDNSDVFMPGRLPKVDDCNTFAMIHGRIKYRPTFLAMMSGSVGAPPFDDPKACANEVDIHGEDGDRQNYSYDVYVCPTVNDWRDERNGSYGYNYQFLGNSRYAPDTTNYKNWPVNIAQVRFPGRVVMAGDCMGTAAHFPPGERLPYMDNSREVAALGNEGFNLDPPTVDPINGELAGSKHMPPERSAADPRHANRANMVWVDGHAGSHTMERLGYRYTDTGAVSFEGENTQWSTNGADVPWTYDYRP